MFSNALGNPGVLIDLWDVISDIRIGWCMMTLRDGMLDIEDIFVRQEYYGSSHQLRLFRAVLAFAVGQDLPVRLWIAHADTRSRAANFKTINDFVRFAHLKVRRSPFTWAAYVAEPRIPFPFHCIGPQIVGHSPWAVRRYTGLGSGAPEPTLSWRVNPRHGELLAELPQRVGSSNSN